MCMHSFCEKIDLFFKQKEKLSVFMVNMRRTSQNASLDPWGPQCEQWLWTTLLHSQAQEPLLHKLF